MGEKQRFAELVGIIIGDGCVCSYDKHYVVEVVGDVNKEQDYLKKHVASLFQEFGGTPHITYRSGALRVRSSKKAFYDKFVNLGFKPGKKGFTVTIPSAFSDWEMQKYILRGIMDTDGSVFTSNKPGSPNYPSLEITTSSEKLCEQVFSSLKQRDYMVTKRKFLQPNGNYIYKIGLNGYKMLEKWFTEIGFSNPSKFNKAKEILKFR